MKVLKVFQQTLLVFLFHVRGFALPTPSYTSEWQKIRSQSDSQSEIIFSHGLNELPIKVYTEVRVQINNEYVIFPGMGSATSDDDRNIAYGGILTAFNETEVRLLAPNRRNDKSTGSVLYMGNSGWIGPNNVDRAFNESHVRVKVWIQSDFPVPQFTTTWENISVYDNETFREIQHNIQGYPTFAVVQIKADIGIYFEAQGSTSLMEYQIYDHGGGVIFGFSETSFRIWYPKRSDSGIYDYAAIFSLADGWGANQNQAHALDGLYRILAWKFDEDWTISDELTVTEITNNNFQSLQLNINLNFMNVEVEVNDGVNKGYRFYGVGSTVNNGNRGAYGGLIYAYSQRNVMLWIPNGIDGHVIEIGGRWVQNVGRQSSDNVTIRINVFTRWEKEKKTTYVASTNCSDIISVSDVLWSTQMDFVDCTVSCTNDPSCKSLFFHAKDKLCFGYQRYILQSGLARNYSGMIHYIDEDYYDP